MSAESLPKMVARARELLERLGDGANPDRLKALKQIRNSVIGNKHRKQQFVSAGAVPRVLELLRADADPDLQREAVTVLGSFAYGSELGLRELIAQSGLPQLVGLLGSGHPGLREAGLRSLKLVLQQAPSTAALSAAPDAAAAAGASTSAAPSDLSPTPLGRLQQCHVDAIVQCLGAGEAGAGAGHEGQGGQGGAGAGAAAAAGAGAGASGSSGALNSAGGSGSATAACSASTAATAAMAATVVACMCRSAQWRDMVAAAGAPAGLLRLLMQAERPDTQVAALEALSLILPHHPPAAALALAHPGAAARLAGPLLRHPDPAVRLLAAGCLATLSRAPQCPQETSEAMQRAALPVLLRLLTLPATRPYVPAVLARLIEGSEALQRAAAAADTVPLLAGLLAAEATAVATPTPPAAAAAAAAAAPAPAAAAGPAGGSVGLAGVSILGGGPAGLREGCLRALGAMCLARDDSRSQLLDSKQVLRLIVRSLGDKSDGVRCAAALCVRALSRCVRTLRGNLLAGAGTGGGGGVAGGGPGDGGDGDLAAVLCGLLEDPNEDVKASAAAAVCNLVLDFSATKAAVLQHGGLPRLVSLLGCPAPVLRHQAAWALSNMAFQADQGVRQQLMQAVPWPRLRELLTDPHPQVAERATCLLRNLCIGPPSAVAAAMRWAGGGGGGGGGAAGGGVAADGGATAAAAGGGGGDLLTVLEELLAAAARQQQQQQQEQDDVFMEEGAAGDVPVPAPATAPSALPSAPPASAAASHALYTLVNLLTGPPAHKDALAHRPGLLARVWEHLCPNAPEDLALPAVWCVINLTWPTERDERLAARCRALQQAGVDERLDELVRSHGSRDVQDRARTAREQVRKGAGAGPGGQEGGVGGGSVVVLTPAAPTAGAGIRDVN